MKCFEKVGERLLEWAIQIRSARGEVIADITTDTIKDLCEDFTLPDKFKKYIDEYKKREGALQSIANYRDHFVHPFHVFWLGYYILNQWRKEGIKPLNLIGKKDENLILKTWFLTSIYHDVGYPAEKLEVLVKDFIKTSVGREMISQFDWSSVLLADDYINHVDRLSKCFAEKTRSEKKAIEFKRWFLKRLLEEHDHGALTALMLCDQGWEESDLSSFVYEAALAIALHSWKRSPNKKSDDEKSVFDIGLLAVENFPLAFFLSFCDTAQEWGRKMLFEIMKNKSALSDITGIESRLEDVKVHPSVIVLIRYLANKNDPDADGKDLRQIFYDVGNKFESTWYLGEERTIMFMIEGRDKDGFSIGGFGPRHL